MKVGIFIQRNGRGSVDVIELWGGGEIMSQGSHERK